MGPGAASRGKREGSCAPAGSEGPLTPLSSRSVPGIKPGGSLSVSCMAQPVCSRAPWGDVGTWCPGVGPGSGARTVWAVQGQLGHGSSSPSNVREASPALQWVMSLAGTSASAGFFASPMVASGCCVSRVHGSGVAWGGKAMVSPALPRGASPPSPSAHCHRSHAMLCGGMLPHIIFIFS